MFTQATFPVLYTIDGSSRHEVLLISAKTPFEQLSSEISRVSAQSPNCTEFMSQYKKVSEEGERVGEIKVRWSPAGRDPKVWPQTTLVTEDNVEAILNLMDTTKDVLEVKLALKA